MSDVDNAVVAGNAPSSNNGGDDTIIQVRGLTKTYDNGFQALKNVDLDIRRGEIFALLGPNGAGKTTLISIICGIVNATSGTVLIDGHDNVVDFRAARSLVGLVPQELTTDAFETVTATVALSRGLFGRKPNAAYIEKVLHDLSLYDKKDSMIMSLSGGMKRRVLIAKALGHEPTVLFLDEPSAGVDVELRRAMWDVVLELQRAGVTIILTTHYIGEAEELADRVGVINNGEIVVVEEKAQLMQRFAQKRLTLHLNERLDAVPEVLREFDLTLVDDGMALHYAFDVKGERTGVTRMLTALQVAGITFRDLDTQQNSLEDIFVDLVRSDA